MGDGAEKPIDALKMGVVREDGSDIGMRKENKKLMVWEPKAHGSKLEFGPDCWIIVNIYLPGR